jgi:hypothetical protein
MVSNEAGSFGSASIAVTQDSSCSAIASSTGRVANLRKPCIRSARSDSLVVPLRATPTTQNLSGKRSPAARL